LFFIIITFILFLPLGIKIKLKVKLSPPLASLLVLYNSYALLKGHPINFDFGLTIDLFQLLNYLQLKRVARYLDLIYGPWAGDCSGETCFPFKAPINKV
jgi:hypothetical protein